MPFRDYFSKQARQYSQHRPTYPQALYDHLAALAPQRRLAWDCGTGSGQAALALAQRFAQVVATDGSEAQVRNAFRRPNISYRVEQVEASSIPSRRVDLITVGTAVHWFDFDAFYREVRRVGRPEGVLAVWTYQLPEINPDIDRWLKHYSQETLDGYWPERIRLLEDNYRTLPFPFEELPAPDVVMQADWQLDELLGFLDSWSGTQRYLAAQGRHPLEDGVGDALRATWGAAEQRRTVRWPLAFRIGRIGPGSRA